MSPWNPDSIDDLDRSIISLLTAEPRASYVDVAKRVGLSESAGRSRIRRLLETRVIVITGRVDPAVLGVGTIAVAFVSSASPLHDVAQRIGEFEEVSYVVSTIGPSDLIVEVRCRDSRHLFDTLEQIRGVDGVDTVEVSTALRYFKQDWSAVGFLTHRDELKTGAERDGEDDVARPMDEIDRRLVAALVDDGRASYGTLARAVGLSQAATRVRVLRLFNRGAISIQAHPAKEAMGVAGFAGIGVTVEGPIQRLGEELAQFPEFTLVAAASGRYDLLGELWWMDDAHLADVLDRVRRVRGVRSIKGYVYLVEEKSLYSGHFLRG